MQNKDGDDDIRKCSRLNCLDIKTKNRYIEVNQLSILLFTTIQNAVVDNLLLTYIYKYSENSSATSNHCHVDTCRSNSQRQHAQHSIHLLSHMTHKDMTRLCIRVSRVEPLRELVARPTQTLHGLRDPVLASLSPRALSKTSYCNVVVSPRGSTQHNVRSLSTYVQEGGHPYNVVLAIYLCL